MSRFSIIIPTYNSSATLSRCLESIVVQDFKDIEVLVLDNLSNDQTLDIARSFSDQLQMTIISEADNGIYDAMNKGIRISRGDYIYFLGSDDRLYDRAVFSQIHAALKEANIDVIYGNVHSHRLGEKYDGPFDGDKITHRNICHQAIVFHKEVFNKVGNFDLKYKVYADWDHNIRWFFRRELKIGYLDINFAEYSDTGMSSAQGDKTFEQQRPLLFLNHGMRHLTSQRRDTLIRRVLSQNDLQTSSTFRMYLKLILFLSRGRNAVRAFLNR